MIDLHAHSTCSDGSLTPTELIRLAKEIGLEAIALTDHDTSDGVPEFIRAGMEAGIETVPGMETALSMDGREVHLVSLYADIEHPSLKRLIADMTRYRNERNEEMLDLLAAAKYPIRREDIQSFGSRSVSRAHIAGLLVDRGAAANFKDAFVHIIGPGCPCYVEMRTPEPEEYFAAIHESGGLAFVAHVHQIDRKDEDHSFAIAERLLDLGADGLETLYCEYDDHLRARTEEVASRRGVLRSGGSDFHGKYKKGLNLGTGYGDLAVPYAFLRAIKEKLGK